MAVQYRNVSAMACGWSKETGVYALAQAVNSLAAADAASYCVEAKIWYPPHADRTKAYGIKKHIRKACAGRGIELQSVKIYPNPLYAVPVVVVTGGGELREPKETGGRADQEIVLVKWTGAEGMLRTTDEREEELRQRFVPSFVSRILSHRDEIFAGKELEIAKELGISSIRQITEGGILAALWELAKEAGMGIEADLKKMSILQETIEVCEYYRLNPYQMTSAGTFLMLTEDGRALMDAMEAEQIKASVIGRLAAGNDKLLRNGEDIRYIDRPAPDEIYKIFHL